MTTANAKIKPESCYNVTASLANWCKKKKAKSENCIKYAVFWSHKRATIVNRGEWL